VATLAAFPAIDETRPEARRSARLPGCVTASGSIGSSKPGERWPDHGTWDRICKMYGWPNHSAATSTARGGRRVQGRTPSRRRARAKRYACGSSGPGSGSGSPGVGIGVGSGSGIGVGSLMAPPLDSRRACTHDPQKASSVAPWRGSRPGSGSAPYMRRPDAALCEALIGGAGLDWVGRGMSQAEDPDLRALLRTLSPKARDTLRPRPYPRPGRRDAISSRRLRLPRRARRRLGRHHRLPDDVSGCAAEGRTAAGRASDKLRSRD